MINGRYKSGGHLKNAYELLNMLYKNHIFQCMGKVFCVELKFHMKYFTHTLKDVIFIQC